MTTEAEFLGAILEDLDDRSRRLVFADWLEERGDPRGDYLRLDCQLHELAPKDPRLAELVARKRQLRQEHAERIIPWEREFALARIKKKIAQLRESDPGLHVFGASKHKYLFNPVLREEEITAHEKRHGSSLPEEYRTYLLELGNGGVGPDYGVNPWGLHEDGSDLATPFPYSTREAEELIARYLQGEYEGIHPKSEVPGCRVIADHGCAAYSLLVVTGEQRGMIWVIGDMGWLPQFAAQTGEQTGFFAWYEIWLDEWLAPGRIDREREWEKKYGR
jgi:uncharacterized protein (TIGR02996 family)